MTMAETIRMLRTQRGVTQEELGNIIGVQKSAIRKYESGLVENIPRSSIKKMADFFGVSPSYLMGWDEPKEAPGEDTLSEGEKMLIDLFRQIPPDQQAVVLAMIRAALDNLR